MKKNRIIDNNRKINGQFKFGHLINLGRYKYNKEIINKRVCEYLEFEKYPTITGLALYIGVSDDTIYNWMYRDNPPWVGTIKKAYQYISMVMQDRLLKGAGNIAGLIFWLKNVLNWTDRQEHQTTNVIEIGSKLQDFLENKNSRPPQVIEIQ